MTSRPGIEHPFTRESHIEPGPFYSCPSLTTIAVDPLNPWYASEDEVLFDKAKTALIQYPPSKAGSYTIPNGVTNIGNWAFDTCRELTNVTDARQPMNPPPVCSAGQL